MIYFAIAFISNFSITRKSEVINRYNLPLHCNIVDFDNSFVAVDGVYDGKQLYFVFLTVKGEIITVPVTNPYNQVHIKLNLT